VPTAFEIWMHVPNMAKKTYSYVLGITNVKQGGRSWPQVGRARGMSLREWASSAVLRQREDWIRFSYSNEDTKDEERRAGSWTDD